MVSTTEATCTSPKQTEKKCSLCGETVVEPDGKPVHSFGEWTVKAQPTYYEEGEKERSCILCGYSETEKIDYIEITANELYTAYEENEVAAEEKYDSKKVKITGVVSDINSSGFLTSTNVLLSVKSKSWFGCVQCNFNSDNEEAVAKLSKGSTVTIIGTCDSLSTFNVMIRNCKIVD